MRLEWNSVSVWSVIKVGFFVNLIIGFLMGLFTAFIFLPFMALLPGGDAYPGFQGLNLAEIGFATMAVILPIMYAIGNAVIGTILLAICAMIFNLVARVVGGIEYEVSVINYGELSDLLTGGGMAGYPQAPTGSPPAAPSRPTGPYAAPPPSQQRPPQPTPPEQTVPRPAPPSQAPTPPPPPPPPPPDRPPAGPGVERIDERDVDRNEGDDERPQ
jgi:hypothetical protein